MYVLYSSLEIIQNPSSQHLDSLHTHRDIERTVHPFPFPTHHLPNSKLTHVHTDHPYIISIATPYHLSRHILPKTTQLSYPHTPRVGIHTPQHPTPHLTLLSQTSKRNLHLKLHFNVQQTCCQMTKKINKLPIRVRPRLTPRRQCLYTSTLTPRCPYRYRRIPGRYLRLAQGQHSNPMNPEYEPGSQGPSLYSARAVTASLVFIWEWMVLLEWSGVVAMEVMEDREEEGKGFSC